MSFSLSLSLYYTLRQVFQLNLKLTVTADFASELDLDILCLCLLNNRITEPHTHHQAFMLVPET